jgi:5-methylcytosine-specific restriction endonuclease McrA
MNLSRHVTLLLNASYEPCRLISGKRALTLLTKGKATVELPTNIKVYPGIYLPSVIRLRVYKHIPIRLQVVTRKNIYLRDGNTCQYCGRKLSGNELTLDHIIPKSRGGRNSWDNMVSCCQECNRRKDDRTPEEAGMPLIHRPLPATVHTGRNILRSIALETTAWRKYLYADSEGEQRFVTRD